MKGILKSRPATPAPSDSRVGEKSKELADKALNLINPARLNIHGRYLKINRIYS